MYVTHVEATGFGGLPTLAFELDRVARFDGPPRALTALADALMLAFAAWDHDTLRGLLARWHCEEVEVDGDGLPEAARWARAPGLASVLAPDHDGLLTVAITVSLDPPLYGRLRAQAARDPRLVDALAVGSAVTLRVGARFSPALDALAVDALGFQVGGESYAIAGADRPAWMTPFLRTLAGRFHRGPLPARRWGAAAASDRAADQHALRRAQAALRGPPLRLGTTVVLPDGPARLEPDAVVPVHRLGVRVENEVGIIGAVHLSGAEILLLEDPPRRWSRWLEEQALADGSPLEQIVLLNAPGGTRVG